MIITISGTPGSGKSTVGKRLAEELGITRYYMGGILREKAAEHGLTLQEYLERGETDASVDREVDDYQRELGEKHDDFLIEGRTSFFLIPHSIKIFLTVDPEIGAERIFNDPNDKRNEGGRRSKEEVRQELKRRMNSDRKRYQQYYNRDVFEPANYDIVIDSSDKSVEEVCEEALHRIRDLQ